MAAKKDKMIPSEKERKRALKYATPKASIQQHLYSICLAHFLVSADVYALSLVSLPSKHLRKYCARVKLTIR